MRGGDRGGHLLRLAWDCEVDKVEEVEKVEDEVKEEKHSDIKYQ